MWYQDKKDAEQNPLKYIGVWYAVSDGEVLWQPIGFQTSEDHPRKTDKTERVIAYISDRMLGRMAKTEQERIEEAKKYADLYLDIVKFRLEMDAEINRPIPKQLHVDCIA